MILVANFIFAIAKILEMILSFFLFFVIIRAILSWVNPDPYNPIVRFLTETTDPLLRPLRRILPRLGAVDFSPLLLLLILYFLQYFLVGSLIDYSNSLRGTAVRGM